jgi:Domain of unknown function (DU1801)
MPRKAVIKTQKSEASVDSWLAKVADESRRKDCATVLRLMKKVTKLPPRLWGTSIVGFGDHTYRGASREVDWFLIGFASRKQDLTLYLMDGPDRHPKQLAKLGKYKTGKGCLYLKSLEDADLGALEELLTQSFKNMRKRA